MNTFNNAIAYITAQFNIKATVKGDIARMQAPAATWRELWKLVRRNTTRTWWTAEDDIVNVYADEYNFVISKRSGCITITDMMLPGTIAGIALAERSCTMSPVMTVPYGTQGREIAVYMDASCAAQVQTGESHAREQLVAAWDATNIGWSMPADTVDSRGRVYPRTPQHAMIEAYGASPANIVHALDAQRNNDMVECVELGYTYHLYCDYMLQRVSDEYRDMLTVTEREYDAQVAAFGKQVADLDSAL